MEGEIDGLRNYLIVVQFNISKTISTDFVENDAMKGE